MQSKVKCYWARKIEPVLCAGRPDLGTFYQEHQKLREQRHLEEVLHTRPGAAMRQWDTKFNILLQALPEGDGEEHWRPSSM